MVPSLKMMRLSMERRSRWSVPVFLPVAIHWRMSGRDIVRRLPARLMRSCPDGRGG